MADTEALAEDARLVDQVRLGDADAFNELARRHLKAVHAAALAITGEGSDAEDVVQDAFVIALERLDDCQPSEKFRPWLLTIARNRALDLLRRNRVRRYEPLDATENAPGQVASAPSPSPLRHTELADTRAHLEAAIATLTPVRREVLLLYDLEGWSHAEIAEHLQLAVPTVRSHLFLARRDLRARLTPELHLENDHD
jgi:RNA polymerase sigma-70 factor (ECF subfamily)